MKPTPQDFFNEEMAKRYDERNSKLSPISDCMHFLIHLALKDLPTKAKILCVGVGTGVEILALAKTYPQWKFVGVEPSLSMLNVCRKRLQDSDIMDRCELIHGYVEDAPITADFDAALSLLVGHFIQAQDRVNFYQNMVQRLKSGGYLINTEISFDLDSDEFPLMLQNWKSVQTLMGATPESLATLPTVLKETLTVLSPNEVKDMIKRSGIQNPVCFFQAFMICGWIGKKE